MLLNGQHASPYGLLRMDSGSVLNSLTNTTYFFLYTTGCSAACFKAGSPYDTDGDSFAKTITAKTAHGAYAYIGHTETGWPESIETYLTEMLKYTFDSSITNYQEEQAI